MADCPLCDWRYDPTAAPLVAYPVGGRFPVVWDGEALRGARGSEAPNGRHVAAGKHLCAEHPLDPGVLLLGPVYFAMFTPGRSPQPAS